jgi:hypothetical protein
MAIHRRNIALTRGIGILPMGYWLEANPTWRFTNGAGARRATYMGSPKGEFAGANESNTLQFAHA